jgi:predicted HicB family RNase H-like nuclease
MGYHGHAQYDSHARVFHGEVQGTRAVLHFTADSLEELPVAFAETVDDYLAWCSKEGREAERPYSGQFVVRIEPELHKALDEIAHSRGLSMNKAVGELLRHAASAENSALKSSSVSRDSEADVRETSTRRKRGSDRNRTRAVAKAAGRKVSARRRSNTPKK